MTKPLKNNYLVWGAVLLAACGGHRAGQTPTPEPTLPLPTAGIAGQPVSVFPLRLLAAEDSLHWEAALRDHEASLARADSIIGSLIKERAPEVSWVRPEELRRAARRAPSVATDPDHMSTPLLQARNIEVVPDPLRSQLRTLEAIAGGRFALIPAALIFRRTGGSAERVTGTAELTIVLVDVRLGRVGWRTVARGAGDDPWTALTRAVKSLTPGLP